MQVKFYNFGNECCGNLVHSFNLYSETYFIVRARNPYGSHNLIMVNDPDHVAFLHGNAAVLSFLAKYGLFRSIVRIARYIPFKFEVESNV